MSFYKQVSCKTHTILTALSSLRNMYRQWKWQAYSQLVKFNADLTHRRLDSRYTHCSYTLMLAGTPLMKPINFLLLMTRTPICQSRVQPGGWRALQTHCTRCSATKTNSVLTCHSNSNINSTTTPQPFYGPFSGTMQVSWRQKRKVWTLWCKGRLTEADTLTIRLGATPSGLTSAYLHHPPFFTGCMPFLPPNQQC